MQFALLFLVANAQALTVKEDQVQNTNPAEDLTIKMDQLVNIPTKIDIEIDLMEKQEAQLTKPMHHKSAGIALVEKSEAKSQLSTISVFHSEQKPIVRAKVMQVMNFLQTTKEEYEQGTMDKKKEIQAKAEGMIIQHSGTRSFNKELCGELWSDTSEAASQLSYSYCPQMNAAPTTLEGAPALKTIQDQPPSSLRSASLAQHFWKSLLQTGSQHEVIDMLDNDVCYYSGKDSDSAVCGVHNVKKHLPYISFPANSKVSDPSAWHCDTTSCITPVQAWAQHEKNCLTTWGPDGKITEVVVPVDLWR